MKRIAQTFGVLLGLAMLMALFFPAMSTGHPRSKRSQTAGQLQSLVGALQSYYTEYGRLPDCFPDGKIQTPADNAKLMRLLMHQNTKYNPRGVAFWEDDGQRRKPCLDPATGALVDAWGQPFFIRFDADFDSVIAHPHRGESPIRVLIAAWSLGQDGQLGPVRVAGGPERMDDVLSWKP